MAAIHYRSLNQSAVMNFVTIILASSSPSRQFQSRALCVPGWFSSVDRFFNLFSFPYQPRGAHNFCKELLRFCSSFLCNRQKSFYLFEFYNCGSLIICISTLGSLGFWSSARGGEVGILLRPPFKMTDQVLFLIYFNCQKEISLIFWNGINTHSW
jgi:hypothetical protein